MAAHVTPVCVTRINVKPTVLRKALLVKAGTALRIRHATHKSVGRTCVRHKARCKVMLDGVDFATKMKTVTPEYATRNVRKIVCHEVKSDHLDTVLPTANATLVHA